MSDRVAQATVELVGGHLDGHRLEHDSYEIKKITGDVAYAYLATETSCVHSWQEITAFGDEGRRFVCAYCGTTEQRPR